MAGTPQFMAPEQIEGPSEDIDDRADQFALACIAYTLLTGREPFRGDSPLAILYQVLRQEPPSLVDFLGPSYELAGRVVQRALAKRPALRFATVIEFATTLRHAVAEAGSAGELYPGARAA